METTALSNTAVKISELAAEISQHSNCRLDSTRRVRWQKAQEDLMDKLEQIEASGNDIRKEWKRLMGLHI